MITNLKYFLSIMIILIAWGCNNSQASKKGVIVNIKTTKGLIQVKLATKEAPLTTKNFIQLAKKGFYNGLTFHRVVPNFVIQGGDPSGDGSGGSKDTIKLEILCEGGKMILGDIAPEDCKPVLRHKIGAISMARTQDPNSASSQFFITLNNHYFLDGKYAAFGYVIKGMDVVKQIKQTDKMISVSIQK